MSRILWHIQGIHQEVILSNTGRVDVLAENAKLGAVE